jgi:hypothetical protein
MGNQQFKHQIYKIPIDLVCSNVEEEIQINPIRTNENNLINCPNENLNENASFVNIDFTSNPTYYKYNYDMFVMRNGKTFYRWMHIDKKHFNHKYKIGLNVDYLQFNPDANCKAGGLYFTTKKHLPEFAQNFGPMIAILELSEEAVFADAPYKFKSNMFTVKEFIEIRELNEFDFNCTEEEIIKMPIRIKYAKPEILTRDMCIMAVKYEGCLLKYIPDPDYEICKLAVENNGLALEYVKKQFCTAEIISIAVNNNPEAIQFVNLF